ncbi:hypothetical protein BCR32DRAFT_328600 [Anaeromyces robustus]|uniref:Chitin-binding type-1 domain-containing protein n=1 Tax=Anaeromyces robustus TaxID=1754192 RepID=A0A1Y1WXJ6_9FUNG|nr:hypothetical protein BCR32DRAFT_328600 [Anaeromyces robustus]|eukprot:ORX78277.1 hypothetical protein BCR32DRAFT_328600 [Anaeromyces robustus]
MRKAILILSFVSLFSLNSGNVIPENNYENNYGNNNLGYNNYRSRTENRIPRFGSRFGNSRSKFYPSQNYQNQNYQNQNYQNQNYQNTNPYPTQNTDYQNGNNFQNKNVYNANVNNNDDETIYDGTVFQDVEDDFDTVVTNYDSTPEFNDKTKDKKKAGTASIDYDDIEVTKDVGEEYDTVTNGLVGMEDGKTIEGTDCTKQNYCSYWMKQDVVFKYNGVDCYVQSAHSGPSDYLGIKGDYREYRIDINGILKCKLAGKMVDNIQFFHVSGEIKDSIDVINKANDKLVEKRNKTNFVKPRDTTKSYTLSNNQLKFTMTLSSSANVWTTRLSAPSIRSDIVIGEKNGRCGKINNLLYFCKNGTCCSKYGYCGRNDNYCKSGCQSNFSICS